MLLAGMILPVVSCGKKDDENTMPEDSNIQQYVEVTRSAQDGAKASSTYKMEFSKSGTWTIYQGDSPSTIDMSVSVGQTSEGSITLDGFNTDQRYYFAVVLNGTQMSTVSERHLPFLGQSNFRDLGGYITADGKKIKWGMIYRSGDMNRFSASDKAYFQSLHVKLVIDFRAEEEVASAPDKLPEGVQTLNLPIHDTLFDRDQIMHWLQTGETAAFDTLLYHANRSFVLEYGEQFSLFLNQLEQAGGPIVFHCNQGKDRAGWATALFLSALGVDKETIIEDYLASNDYLKNYIEKTIQMINMAGMNGESIRPLLEVKKEYIETAFDLVEKEYGSMENYLKNQLGVDVEKLREMYLE
jgi:protein-tyrosine phosphatase